MPLAEIPIAAVVELLAERWRTRCRDLEGYLASTFGVPPPGLIPTRMHLSHMADGTVRPQRIGHNFIAVWVVEASVVREVPLTFEWLTRFDTDKSGRYYLMHAYSFVADGTELLLSERYGPGLVHRSLARLVPGPPLSAKWVTCWHTGHEQRSTEPDLAGVRNQTGTHGTDNN